MDLTRASGIHLNLLKISCLRRKSVNGRLPGSVLLYCLSVKTIAGKIFLQLIKKHFPKESSLSKIFKENTGNVSYSCLGNIASEI